MKCQENHLNDLMARCRYTGLVNKQSTVAKHTAKPASFIKKPLGGPLLLDFVHFEYNLFVYIEFF